jgi:hypothetical protein
MELNTGCFGHGETSIVSFGSNYRQKGMLELGGLSRFTRVLTMLSKTIFKKFW